MRTAIAVMAFGFLVEKFDLFLELGTQSFDRTTLDGHAPSSTNAAVGDIAGLPLIVLGAAMMVVATVRFRRVGQDIDAAEARPARRHRHGHRAGGASPGAGRGAVRHPVFTVGRRLM